LIEHEIRIVIEKPGCASGISEFDNLEFFDGLVAEAREQSRVPVQAGQVNENRALRIRIEPASSRITGFRRGKFGDKSLVRTHGKKFSVGM
jgi:hypothetical protein